MSDDDSGVREAAAEALGELGPEAAGAVPDLTKALSDKDSGVCEAVAVPGVPAAVHANNEGDMPLHERDLEGERSVRRRLT